MGLARVFPFQGGIVEVPSLDRITLPISSKGLLMGSHDQQSHEVLRGPASGSRWIEHPWRADSCHCGFRLGLGGPEPGHDVTGLRVRSLGTHMGTQHPSANS
jgi:hypothetical protein